MSIQKVFRAGNSDVVAIPREAAMEAGLAVGQPVKVEVMANGEGIKISKTSKTVSTKSKKVTDKEFEKWWKTFEKENGEILDELAVR